MPPGGKPFSAALLTPIGVAVGIAAAVAVALDPDYTASNATVVMQVLLVAVPVVAALGASRWWGARIATARDDSPAVSHTLT